MAREQASEALDAARRIGLRGLVMRIELLTPAAWPRAVGPAAEDARRQVRSPTRDARPGDAGPNAHRLGHAPLRDRTQLRRAAWSSTRPGVREVEEINADEGVRWVFSFLTADKLKSYCVYEASSPDAILAAARRAGLPADVIVEVERVEAAMFA